MINETASTGFIRKYPLSAQELVCTPMILHAGVFQNEGLPLPTHRHIRDLTEYAGIPWGTVRTNLSRLRKEGRIVSLDDAVGVTRYRMTEASMAMGAATLDRHLQPPGFLLAIFSFAADNIEERNFVRETLKYYGFKKLAQNTYINGRINTGSLQEAIKAAGLAKHLYLFHCPDIDDPDLTDRILDLFDVEERTRFLHRFLAELTAFLNPDNLDTRDFLRRLCYAGPVQWNICYRDELPVPTTLLPGDYPLQQIISLYDGLLERYRSSYVEYYIALEKGDLR
jgi:DNA-binding transcriptional regulator PaaX